MLNNAVGIATGPYEVPNVKVDGYNVFTNNLVAGAFRGFGALQATFGAEMQMARLADALGMIRWCAAKNALREGSILPTQSVIPAGVSVREDADAMPPRGPDGRRTEAPAERKAGLLLRGVGVALDTKNVFYRHGFPERCTARCDCSVIGWWKRRPSA